MSSTVASESHVGVDESTKHIVEQSTHHAKQGSQHTRQKLRKKPALNTIEEILNVSTINETMMTAIAQPTIAGKGKILADA